MFNLVKCRTIHFPVFLPSLISNLTIRSERYMKFNSHENLLPINRWMPEWVTNWLNSEMVFLVTWCKLFLSISFPVTLPAMSHAIDPVPTTHPWRLWIIRKRNASSPVPPLPNTGTAFLGQFPCRVESGRTRKLVADQQSRRSPK